MKFLGLPYLAFALKCTSAIFACENIEAKEDTTYQEGESSEEDGKEDGINDYKELLDYLDDDDDYV